ncbi:alpha/beta-hydrolase [Neocallimastix lanati (nom. inval.)]|jgi:para-nitrobenzyl esterase|uniref:Carboxylic ester hydrolase n=1 Tax=Neocallimastix californiae TaxID=1754190 RepID=A0A1Y2BD07_9FUNG|nr:alpha/beta-hydrolase [Neocallimastix sp. JGI-2020a]ORY32654.1 alpha/beta-hydrolase [Neocallimastix californiae]|eukprot:ORY32654.1 alpha/beta-hydrolase [Neocallimastix californiae]
MDDLIVKTKYGLVKGFVKDGIRCWLGIPYAKPPLGELRFRRSVQCDPWDDIKECTQYGGSPPQFLLSSLFGKSTDTEDCLNLNIWRENSNKNKLPVHVWIHGGYLHGRAINDPYYNGDCFAKDGVLFVSISYRLGPLGCYDFSIYNKEAFDSNCTLSDDILALKWINENIEAFGGDPNNITINGQSSGGASVLALMACPSAKGLFQKVICQSGFPDGNHSRRSNKLLMDLFLEYLKITPEEVEKIRDLDIKTLQLATDYVFNNLSRYPGIFWPGFVYDDLLPEDCYTSLKNGSADGIKLIIGTCKNESTFFRECPKNIEEIKKMLENNHMSDKFEALEDFYYQQKKGGDATPPLNFGKDYLILLGSIEVADILSQNKQDVWMYRYDFMPPLLKLMGMKAAHGLDIQGIINKRHILDELLWLFAKPSSKKMIYNYMHNSWINFVKTGNPNGEHLKTNWEKYEIKKRKTLIFDRETSLKENLEKDSLDFWKGVMKTHSFYR